MWGFVSVCVARVCEWAHLQTNFTGVITTLTLSFLTLISATISHVHSCFDANFILVRFSCYITGLSTPWDKLGLSTSHSIPHVAFRKAVVFHANPKHKGETWEWTLYLTLSSIDFYHCIIWVKHKWLWSQPEVTRISDQYVFVLFSQAWPTCDLVQPISEAESCTHLLLALTRQCFIFPFCITSNRAQYKQFLYMAQVGSYYL